MSQAFYYPPVSATNPSVGSNGIAAPTSSTEVGGIGTGGVLTPVSIDASGNLKVSQTSAPLPANAATASNQVIELSRLSGSLVPTAYDEIDITYVPSGAGAGQIATAVYKLATVTVKTLTLSYDGSDRLSSVVAS